MTDPLGREPMNTYGSLESTMVRMRGQRPMDLTMERWRKAHPQGGYSEWRAKVQRFFRGTLHYDPGPVDLRAATLGRIETAGFIREKIEFNTASWFRVPGYFYIPKGVKLPAPALVVMHEWGGPIVFGADRVCGEAVHPLVSKHRNACTGGVALADMFASRGYAVVSIDAHHFGARIPRGVGATPPDFDPLKYDQEKLMEISWGVSAQLYYGVRQLNWAGTTWAGVNFGDDMRSVDYLLSRPEVDGQRIGVTGLSCGGWRTNILAALDDRIKAAVPVGWMTTGDTQQAYNLEGAIAPCCMIPGAWRRMDVPDLIAMCAPKAVMPVVGLLDTLFPPRGIADAGRHIQAAYQWAGCPERLEYWNPEKEHCYDAEIQARAVQWFDTFLK